MLIVFAPFCLGFTPCYPLSHFANSINNRYTTQETLPAYYRYLQQTTESVYTAADFTGDLRKLGGYLGQKAVSRITQTDLAQWLSRLASPTGEQLTAKTVSCKVAAIKHYFCWLVSCKVITADPAARLITRRITSPLPTVLYAAECQRLLQTASSDPRAYLLILLLLETGIKKAELLALRSEDFDFSDLYSPVLWITTPAKRQLRAANYSFPPPLCRCLPIPHPVSHPGKAVPLHAALA